MDWGFIISDIEKRLKSQFGDESTGHDYWHFKRVTINALKILNGEKDADPHLTLLSAWLHDIGDPKLHNGEDKTEEEVGRFLKPYDLKASFEDTIIRIIHTVSFQGGFNQTPKIIEAKIVRDADRLDAIGAIGIARAFAYGGAHGRLIHDPDLEVKRFESSKDYRKDTSPTTHHFYQKLLLLKDQMITKTAKKIATERHDYMLEFLDRLYKETDAPKP